ncbi:coenzyme F420 hydrogenase subunit alpha [Methanoregula sp. UBA64]|jgi:coenzyme F420 hydrogenase subunit alpha|uniref:coenzyme F420 hydrogenase subunit alpha n=1 Tax=Methanoregula sp. UBA64 TaxID=1915554 RepID=UPI0025E4890F|nr:coenzyme F420 hydrogenase subunit alpha [Methanoregula sp. UBA64]
MTRVVSVSPTVRNEGRSGLVLETDEDGIVTRGRWVGLSPVRGFERFCTGKKMVAVPTLASRVCGICPVPHVLAGVGAMEASIGCEIPRDALLLRRIIHSASRLSVHTLHALMVLPDLYYPGTETRINPFSPEPRARALARRIQRIREIGQTCVQIAGGEAIHPGNPRVGGMHSNISPQAKTKIADLAKEGEVLAREHRECMLSLIRDLSRRDSVEIGGARVPFPRHLGYHDQGSLATDPLYGTSSLEEHPSFDLSRYTEVSPVNWYGDPAEVTYSDPAYPGGGTLPVGTPLDPVREMCPALPLYDGQPVEVGAAARLRQFSHFDEKGTIGQLVARQMECVQAAAELADCTDRLDPAGPVLAPCIPPGNGSLGWAANEAPRGTLVHIARVREGKVIYFKMLVPTSWNMPTAGLALAGSPWQLAELIIRGYDPCISCASH